MASRKSTSEKTLFEEAKQLEATRNLSDLPQAAALYVKILKIHPLHIDATNRLMVVYRKLGEQAKELKFIKTAIKTYEDFLEKDRKQWIRENKAKASQSAALAAAMGLLNEKGKPIYENEILAGWKKRLLLLQQRIAKNKAVKARLNERKRTRKDNTPVSAGNKSAS